MPCLILGPGGRSRHRPTRLQSAKSTISQTTEVIDHARNHHVRGRGCPGRERPRRNHRRADRCDHPRDPRLHLRQRPVALPLDGTHRDGQSMGHEAIGIVEAVGRVGPRSRPAISSSCPLPTRTVVATSATKGCKPRACTAGSSATGASTARKPRPCASRSPTARCTARPARWTRP